MQMTPTIAIHMRTALTALLIGPVAAWARLGRTVLPQWHRALGYAFVTCMLGEALSSLLIRDFRLPNIGGFTPIHLFVPLTFALLYRVFAHLRAGNVQGHRRAMQGLYFSGCIVAGAFTLLPHRYQGNLLWSGLRAWM